MARNKNDRQTVTAGIVLDNKGLKKSTSDALRIVNRLVTQMNKMLSKIGSVQPKMFQPTARQRITEDPNNYLEREKIKNDITKYEKKRSKAGTKEEIAETEGLIETSIQDYNKLLKEQLKYDLQKNVRSQKSLYKQGKQVGTEVKDVSTYPYATYETSFGKSIQLYAKEENIVKSIKDIHTGIEKTITRVIRKQQELTNAGKVWKTVADDTYETLNNEKKGKRKNFFTTLFARFKSVAIYRTIRNILKEIANAFTESLSAIAMKSDEFNESFSNINSSMQQLKASMGVAFYQILMVVEPIITKISNAIVEFANGLSYVIAKLTNSSKYLQINTEYWKDYRDSVNGALLEFDDFTTLSSQGLDYNKLFKEVNVEDAQITKWSKILNIVESIGLFVSGTLQSISGLGDIISGIFSLLQGDVEGFFEGFKNGFVNMWEGFVNAAIGALNLVIDALNLIFVDSNPLFWILNSVGVDTKNVRIPHIPKAYKDGGNFRTGDFFVANENGNTELIASSNSGGGSVMNLDQWAQISEASFFNALSKYDAAQNGGSGGLDMDKLGTAIARSSGFRNEINRRNVGLNLV